MGGGVEEREGGEGRKREREECLLRWDGGTVGRMGE